MSIFQQESPWTTAAGSGNSIANTLGSVLLQLPGIRAQMAQRNAELALQQQNVNSEVALRGQQGQALALTAPAKAVEYTQHGKLYGAQADAATAKGAETTNNTKLTNDGVNGLAKALMQLQAGQPLDADSANGLAAAFSVAGKNHPEGITGAIRDMTVLHSSGIAQNPAASMADVLKAGPQYLKGVTVPQNAINFGPDNQINQGNISLRPGEQVATSPAIGGNLLTSQIQPPQKSIAPPQQFLTQALKTLADIRGRKDLTNASAIINFGKQVQQGMGLTNTMQAPQQLPPSVQPMLQSMGLPVPTNQPAMGQPQAPQKLRITRNGVSGTIDAHEFDPNTDKLIP